MFLHFSKKIIHFLLQLFNLISKKITQLTEFVVKYRVKLKDILYVSIFDPKF